MDPKKEVESLLKEHGAVLSRQRKHKVYKFPNGKNFVMSVSPSDHKSDIAALCALKKLLGLTLRPSNSSRPRGTEPRKQHVPRPQGHRHQPVPRIGHNVKLSCMKSALAGIKLEK